MLIGLMLTALLLARGDTLGTIMPTGDSITDGQGSTDGVGYRNDLASLLSQHGIEFSHVGDELGGGQNPDFPGHFRGGARIEEFYPPAFGNGWGSGTFDIGPVLDQIHPDVLLIHLGTNNVPSGDTPLGPYSLDGGATLFRSYAGYTAELISFVASRYEGYPAGTPLVVVSRIIPIVDMVDRVEAFNGYLDEMAHDMARGAVTGAPVHVVSCDQFTPFMENPLLFTGLPGDYMADWGHPNDLGYGVIAGSYLATLRDDAPPGTVEDLAVWGQGPHSVRLWWTSPGDDWWSGTAASATMRFAQSPITDQSSFDQAWELVNPFAPGAAGFGQQVTAGGLPSGRTYWCALTVADERGNVSGVSNSPSVAIAPADSLVEEFLAAPAAGVWDLGDDYYVEGGTLRAASPFPVWLAPAVMIGEPGPWEVAIRIPSTAPPSETGRVGVVLLGNEPQQACDGFALVCPGGELELRVLEDGVLGVAVDSETSVHGPLIPDATLGAVPFIWDGMLHIRALRDGLPDGILSTGIPAQLVPATRYGGIIMQGALGWGVECFRVGGPGLWQAPDPFHLVSPDSGARLGVPPVLVWRHSMDPDPWDGVRYSVHWAPTPDYSPGATTIVECGADTSCMFPSDEFSQGSTVFWKVVATDGTGLTRESSETLWWFRADTLNAHPALPVLAVSPPWPNPSAGTVTLRWSLMPDQPVRVALHDVSGRVVATQSLAASRDLRWSVPPAVPAGVYALSVRSGALEARFRFVLDR